MIAISTFSIGKPLALFAIFLLVPAIFLVFFRFKRMVRVLGTESSSSLLKRLKISLFARTVFRSLAWIFAVLALSEISWGTKKIPVQKSGSNVSFVFDISYSMLAKDISDGTKKISRLDAVKIYASSLSERLDGASVSAVLAKGDGFVALPETEDRASFLSLLENLSPHLMTSAGTSLGKGIEAALGAIPAQSAKSNYIFVFTDGDETDNSLEKSLEMAVKFGVPVTLIGFGSEIESEITAGDGKTKVVTALRSQKMREIAESVNKRNFRATQDKNLVSYIDFASVGSVWTLLNQVKKSRTKSTAENQSDEKTLSYETQTVNRHTFFISLALIFFMLSFVAGEFTFDTKKCSHLKKILARSFVVISVFALSSCKSEKKAILDGVWSWYSGDYAGATADFLNTTFSADEDSLAHEYALFGLAATYLTLGEADAALERIEQMRLSDEAVPADLRSAAFYNAGIMFEQKNEYEKAAAQFKKAILANPKNTSAKINLELCERETTKKRAKSAEAEMQGVNEEKSDNSELQSEIFNLIHEAEGKKWRNMQNGGASDTTLDY